MNDEDMLGIVCNYKHTYHIEVITLLEFLRPLKSNEEVLGQFPLQDCNYFHVVPTRQIQQVYASGSND